MGCNRRTAHEHIISCLKLSLAKQAKQTFPERLMQHLLTGKLALDVAQQCWLQTARLHYFIDLSGSRRHIGWQVPILRSQRSCRVRDVTGCAQPSKRVSHPCSRGLAMSNVTFSLCFFCIFSILSHGRRCARVSCWASEMNMDTKAASHCVCNSSLYQYISPKIFYLRIKSPVNLCTHVSKGKGIPKGRRVHTCGCVYIYRHQATLGSINKLLG